VGRGLEYAFLAPAVVLYLGVETGPRVFRPCARPGLFWMNMVRILCESVDSRGCSDDRVEATGVISRVVGDIQVMGWKRRATL
jgi:hypothetical protein